MQRALLPILLLQAVTAFAQPRVGAEISTDPIPMQATQRLLATPAVAMARDRIGVAIAWTSRGADGDRISAIRLDATGHFTGPLRAIPVATSGPVDAYAPSIAPAPGGDGFTMAWLEAAPLDATSPHAVYCRLRADLAPSLAAVLPPLPIELTTPAIVRSGTSTWISAGRYTWQFRDDDTLGDALNSGVAASDMAITADYPQIVGGDRARQDNFTCTPGCAVQGGPFRGFCPESCRIYPYKYVLQLVALYRMYASWTFDFDSAGAPAIGTDGRDVLMAWFLGPYGSLVATRLIPPAFTGFDAEVRSPMTIGTFGPDSGATRPDIAADGDRYVVVWRTATPDGSHDIVGASIDRAGNILPLSIAMSAADERDPSVVALGNGTFLVAYEKIEGAVRRIAGRFVTFGNRAHAVH
jgi:hypothetical protein